MTDPQITPTRHVSTYDPAELTITIGGVPIGIASDGYVGATPAPRFEPGQTFTVNFEITHALATPS